jgi:FkbM family methyltransferase
MGRFPQCYGRSMQGEAETEARAVSFRSLTTAERLLSRGLRMLPIRHGKHRLLDRILPQPLGAPGCTVLTEYHGARLRIDIDDLVGWHFAMLRSFDPEVSEVIVSAAGSGEEVFWDVGANKGACSYAIAAALPRAKIVAIEPQARLAVNLVHNLQQVCPDRFEHYGVGISTTEETANLIIPGGNRGQATLHPGKVHADGASESVQLVTASTVAQRSKFGWPTLVKIDVEGHEPDVIESLTPALERKACKAIVFESHFGEREAFSAISARVTACGYDVFGILKTPFATRLVRATSQIPRVADYVIAERRLPEQSGRFASLIQGQTTS